MSHCLLITAGVGAVAQLNMEYTIPAGRENEYTIFFYNCKEKAKVSFHLDIELYNTVNGKKNYLSGLLPELRFHVTRLAARPALPTFFPTAGPARG